MPDQKSLPTPNPRFTVHGPNESGHITVRNEDGDTVLVCLEGTSAMHQVTTPVGTMPRSIQVWRKGTSVKVTGYGVDVVCSLTTGFQMVLGRIGP